MGAEPRRLGIPGELELAGRGVSTCGVCDGAFFKGEKVAVIGGGDSAMEDAIFISKYASHLDIVHRRPEFRASKIMLERAAERDNIELRTPFVPEEFIAGDDGKIRAIALKNAESGESEELEVGGAFVAIGHIPRSELVADQVDVDEDGYVVTEGKSTKTNLEGVFAIGDLVDRTYRQAVTAAGTGCMGALDAEWYLRDTPPSPEAHWQHGGERSSPLEVAGAVQVRAHRAVPSPGLRSRPSARPPHRPLGAHGRDGRRRGSEPRSRGSGLRSFDEFEAANETWPRGDRPAAIREAAADFRARFAVPENRVRAIRTVDIASAPTRSSSRSAAPPTGRTRSSTSSTGCRSSSSTTSRAG